MTPSELTELIEQLRLIGSDTQRIEVKSAVGKSTVATLSAFSNGSGGTLIVGLSEPDGFTPVANFSASQAQDQLESRCLQLTPPVRPDISILDYEGTSLLVADIKEMSALEKPCYASERGVLKGSYIRTGDGDSRLSEYEVNRLLEEHTQPKWDEQEVDEASLVDLDDEALDAFLAIQKERRPKTFAQGTETALHRLRILKSDHPTLAALLALGEYPQEFYPRLTVTFAQFPGTSKGDITTGVRLLDSATLTGTIPELVSAGIDIVKKNMRTAGYIGDKARTNLPDYPLVAVREALVNALMHRDYSPHSLGSQVQINMFVDRLEITSPGGLYGGVTLRNLGQAGVSSTRNQRLTTLLEDTPLPEGGMAAENRGTGIPTINQALANALMPEPEIINRIDSFTIIFHRRRVASEERYGTARDQVLRLLEEKPSASTSELVDATKLSRTAVQKALNELIAEKVVEKTEPGRSPKQRYRLRK
ncbi:MAG: ATP-binding protein [Corynebacterium camporealensis]|uniref:ATP-binding protein n=1 Tax=Corynebacterium camporealensis TaxID=161896 RepID=UPI002A91F911|nr:ATP-binding protein [Corynebacterium camporealensis]MDY5841027.1 ATP-binding protein [Corynebacterium camporealensis]